MIIKENPRLNVVTPQFEVEEDDFSDVEKIRFVVENKNCPHCGGKLPNGWEVLQKYWQMAKDSLMIIGMDGIRTRAKRELSDLKWAILKGFVECCAVPERIIKQHDEIIENKKMNGGGNYNDYEDQMLG